MSFENQYSESESPSRRAVLAALGGGVVSGLAGCSSSGGSTETPASGGGGPTETATPTDNSTPTTSSRVDCGRNVLADIPGEVVHNGVDALTVLAHGVCKFTGGANILVRVQNTGDQTLTPELSAGEAENDFSIAARALSSEGNQLDNGQIIAGPAEIKPGTEATLTSRASINEDLAEYELCILTRSLLGMSEWENRCGG